MTNNTTKNNVLELFPDNNNNEISAADMRSFVNSIFSDKEVSVVKVDKYENIPFNNSKIYEGTIVIIYGESNTAKNGVFLSKVNQPLDITQLFRIAAPGTAEPIPAFVGISDVSVENIINESTLNRLNDMLNITQSSGVVSGCDLTDNLDGTVNISEGEALIRNSSDSETSPIFSVKTNEQLNLAIPNDITSYIYLDYNNGSPIFKNTTIQTDIDCISKCLAYIVHRHNDKLDIIDDRGHSIDVSRKTRTLFKEFSRFIHIAGGSQLSSPSGLSLAVTAGGFYYTTSKIPHPSFNTSVAGTLNENVFTLMYRDGTGGWNRVYDQKTINTTLYDNGTGTLSTIGNNKYSISWVYIVHDSPSRLIVLPAQTTYADLNAATNATPPPIIPDILSGMGSLIGAAVYEKSATTFNAILSAVDKSFSTSYSLAHNDLSGLQGGALNEYLHLTSAEYTSFQTGVRSTDIEITDPTKGVILTSPNLSRWRITVDDTGNLITTQI